jgi:enamine deaminase RidA (YjgF/YER057c/UK114 family)
MIERIGILPLRSSVVIHNGIVYLAGQVGEGSSFSEQCKSALSRADELLASAGSDREHILQATVYLANVEDFAAMNSIWLDWISPGKPPARVTVVAKFVKPEYKVELVLIAAQIRSSASC